VSKLIEKLWKQERLKTLLTGIYVFCLIELIVHLSTGEHVSQETRASLVTIVIFSAALWIQLLRDRASWFTCAMACFLLVTVDKITLSMLR
jgi:hypothetical protein